MTIGKGDRCASPVHVHVDEETPVHVHVKKTGRKTPTQCDQLGHSSNMRRSTAMAKTRSRSPPPGPWIPPPGRSTKGSKPLSWQGTAGRLEIHPPRADLSTDEEDQVESKMRKYENKIDCLMNEMGTLKNEVELQKTKREIDKRDDLLEESRRILEDQETKIGEYKEDLEETVRENRILRRSMERSLERICQEDINKAEQDHLTSEKEELMKKLVEVEIDGQAAAKQCAALKDAIRRLREEKRISASDSTMISKQRELLMEKLADFEGTNRNLRRLLRDAHHKEAAGLRLGEQRDVLIRKLAESDDFIQRLRASSVEKEREMNEIKTQLASQREENMAMAGLQGSMESTRAHLQKQLRMKEADSNRMAVQIRGLESQLAQEKIDVDHLTDLLVQAKDKSERDKEALKKATRVQKQRASRSEDAMDMLNSQLLEKETQLADIQNQMDEFRSRMEKLSKEKNQSLTENVSLRNRICELESLLESADEKNKSQQENLNMKLHHKISESSTLRLENDRLKDQQTIMTDDYNKQAEQLNNKCIELQSKYESSNACLIEANSEKERQSHHSSRLSEQVERSNSDVEKFVSENTQLKHERDQLKTELLKSRTFYESKIDTMNSSNNTLNLSKETLQADLDILNKDRDRHRSENRELLEEMHRLSLDFEKASHERDTNQREKVDLKNQLNTSLDDSNNLKKQCDFLKTNVEIVTSKQKKNVSKLDENIAENNRLLGQIDQLKYDIGKLKRKNSSLKSERCKLKTSLDTVQAELSQLRGEWTSTQSLNDSLKVDVQVTTKGLEIHESQCNRLAQQLDSIKTENYRLSAENGVLVGENERIKTSMAAIEDKMSQADLEISGLKSSLRQYENLVEEYRSQVNKSRQEADDLMVKFEESQKEVVRVQREGDIELERVRGRLQQRLHELEPLPELLKTTELRLQDTSDKTCDYERRNLDQTRLLAELTSKASSIHHSPPRSGSPHRSRSPTRPRSPGSNLVRNSAGWNSSDTEMLRELMRKVDHLTNQLESMRDKWHISQDENRSLQSTLEMLERKLREADDQNRELVNTLSKKEEVTAQNQLHLEEKCRENASLTRQLENSLTESRRQAEQLREKASQKERQCHSHILDLEGQLSQTRGEISRIKREKEEAERRYNSRLYDLKDRLEQSHSTNRSMQNYVQFLKNSYANIFGDTTVGASSCGAGRATSPLRSSALQ